MLPPSEGVAPFVFTVGTSRSPRTLDIRPDAFTVTVKTDKSNGGRKTEDRRRIAAVLGRAVTSSVRAASPPCSRRTFAGTGRSRCPPVVQSIQSGRDVDIGSNATVRVFNVSWDGTRGERLDNSAEHRVCRAGPSGVGSARPACARRTLELCNAFLVSRKTPFVLI